MELTVKGMTCGHCEAAVQRAVKQVAPQAEIVIERARNRVSIKGDADPLRVASAIRDEGYEVAGIDGQAANPS